MNSGFMFLHLHIIYIYIYSYIILFSVLFLKRCITGIDYIKCRECFSKNSVFKKEYRIKLCSLFKQHPKALQIE